MAGFMQGVASAFNVQQVPTINVTRAGDNNNDTVRPVYQQAMDSNALQSAGFSGAGTALERIADFYLEMAENIFLLLKSTQCVMSILLSERNVCQVQCSDSKS